MITNEYERTYVCVQNAQNCVKNLPAVVEFLEKQTAPVTCKQIGEAVCGKEEYDNYTSSYRTKMGKMLHNLRKGGFISVEEVVSGAPFEIEVFGYRSAPTIRVHDDNGNTYDMPDPNSVGGWGTYKKTIIPKVKYYKWVG